MRPLLALLIFLTSMTSLPAETEVIRIVLEPEQPSASRGQLMVNGEPVLSFPVGFGRHGLLPENSRFQAGYSLLGRFRINAILSPNRFEMDEDLIRASGKSERWLRENLFRNMNSIDFDGDGQGGEYGAAFISLAPLNSVSQPFSFQSFRGTFRWYSYALHGTQDERRIGQCITGGCINVGKAHLADLLPLVQLGDTVAIVRPP